MRYLYVNYEEDITLNEPEPLGHPLQNEHSC